MSIKPATGHLTIPDEVVEWCEKISGGDASSIESGFWLAKRLRDHPEIDIYLRVGVYVADGDKK